MRRRLETGQGISPVKDSLKELPQNFKSTDVLPYENTAIDTMIANNREIGKNKRLPNIPKTAI